jgi:membrane protein DedA with SNARE-associated domain
MNFDVLLHNPYWVIVPLSIVEGPIAAIGSGAGWALGYVNPVLAFAALMAGSVIQDLIYFGLGRWAASSARVRGLMERTKLLRDTMKPIAASWRHDMLGTLLTLKFAYGLYAPFLVTAGVVKAPFWRLLGISTACSAAALILWLAIGYGLARFYGVAGPYAPYAVGVLGVLGVAALVLVMRRAKRRLALDETRPPQPAG